MIGIKNILLLMTDQHRLDHVSFSGSDKVHTPEIDRIAESVGFTCCQSTNPICTPSRTALITGKYSHQIGTLQMSGDLSLQHGTFMSALQKSGYHTSGIGKFHYLQTWEWSTKRGKGLNLVALKDEMKKYGYDYIWQTSGKQQARRNYCDYCEYLDSKGHLEEYRDLMDSSGPNYSFVDKQEDRDVINWPFPEEEYIDIVTADNIIKSIENRPSEKPFFILGSFSGPHKPFDPPQRYLDMVEYEEKDDFIPGDRIISEENKKKLYRKRWAYKAMIALIDEQIGRIFDTLNSCGILEDTVIIFTTDHGEMLGDHSRIQKSIYWKESVTIPTAIRHPDYLNKKVNSTPIENIDIAATILEIAGINPQEGLSKPWPAFNDIVPALSLMPIVRGEKEKIRDFAFSECEGKWQMIQTEDWKYIRHLQYDDPDNINEEFYNLKTDVNETQNLIHDNLYSQAISWCRRRRNYVLDNTPPAQTKWAKLITD